MIMLKQILTLNNINFMVSKMVVNVFYRAKND